MDRETITCNFSILAFLVISILKNNFKNTPMIILCLLGYICLNMTYYIIKRVSWRNVLLTLSIMFLIFCYKYINIYFILFLPVNIYEATEKLKVDIWVEIALIMGIGLLVQTEIIDIYILACLFSYFLVKVTYVKNNKIISHIIEIDRLKEKNYRLNCSLNRDSEYEAQVKYLYQLEERNKIAQEIHDNIGHTLSASLMQLEASKLLMDKDINKSISIIDNTIIVLREGMENIRKTLKNIKPPLEQLGINRVKLLIDDNVKSSGIFINFMYKGNLEQITNIQWRVIYDNIRECLTNSMKYSASTEIKVCIEVLNRYVKIEVKDNGKGANNIVWGLGIAGIEERTQANGGKVIIDGSEGFSVISLLPI